MILVLIVASCLVGTEGNGDNTQEPAALVQTVSSVSPQEASVPTSEETQRCSNMDIRMEEMSEWFDEPFKDLYGQDTSSPPLPFVAPFTRNTSGEINKQINRELFAHYTYLSMALHFDRDDIDLPGFSKYFKELAEEEMDHAKSLMKYQNMRGGRVKLQQVMTPCKDQWGDGLQAVQDALDLEKEEYKFLLHLHNIGQLNDDPQLQDYLESEFLEEQVESIKKLSNHVNILTRLNDTNYNLGEYQFDKITLKGE